MVLIQKKVEPAWLLAYRKKNAARVAQQPLKKSMFFDVPLFEKLLTPRKGKTTFSVTGAQVLSLPEALCDKKIAQRVHEAFTQEALPTEQFEAYVNAHFTAGAVIVVDGKIPLVTITVDAQEITKYLILFSGNTNPVLTHTICGQAPLVNFTTVVNDSTKATLVTIPTNGGLIHFQTIVKNEATFNHSALWMFGDKTKATYTTTLLGSGSLVNQNDVLYLTSTQEAHVSMSSLHKAPSSVSDTKFKCVLNDTAKQSFDGLIRIERVAQKTNAYLEANAMLLSNDARSTNIPKLEIEADDVKATHSATVEHIEEEKLFYLQTRGLTNKAAQELIIQSFLESSISAYPEKVKELVKQLITQKIAGVITYAP